MAMRVIHIQPKSRAGALAVGVGVVAVGAVLVVVGLSLLLALAAGGIVAGTGYALYRRLVRPTLSGAERQRLNAQRSGLDPELEVPAPSKPNVRPLPPRSHDSEG